jgi:hypothetical protein
MVTRDGIEPPPPAFSGLVLRERQNKDDLPSEEDCRDESRKSQRVENRQRAHRKPISNEMSAWLPSSLRLG